MEWILLIYVYAGVFAKGDSVAMTTIENFPTEESCETAARGLPRLVKGTAKEVLYLCIPKPKGRA